jgi:hypothetical protein
VRLLLLGAKQELGRGRAADARKRRRPPRMLLLRLRLLPEERQAKRH